MVVNAGIKPRIQRELRFVPEQITNWKDRDFIAVTNRSGSEGVLVAPFDHLYVGSFWLQKRVANKIGRTEAIICDFCATWQRGTNSAVISFQKDTSIVSFLCCADLLCSLHVRDKTPEAALSRVQLREDISVEMRIRRLHTKLESIVSNF